MGNSSGPEKVLCVGREMKRKKRGKKKWKKETEERVKETDVLRDFFGCRGNSFLFVLLIPWTFATPVTSFLPRHLQRMHR